jgi:uncharacterized DUF497 family protein
MGRIIVSEDGRFEWDEEKNIINKEKHGFEFKEILPVFDDRYFLERYDKKNSSVDEDRFIGIGKIGGVTFIFCCYTERNGRTRIYSARPTEPKEEKLYYENLAEALR